MNDEEIIIGKKARQFFDTKTEVHIEKKNGWIHNGFILELQGDLIILDDIMKGAMPIYFLEILEIEKRNTDKK